ncbi:MAG: protein translocase subunit SecD [Firmicutes bacterium]|nr:protein translocase subunit SecD [Bacillota bacterium]
MKKRRAIRNFILIGIVALLGLLLTIFSFDIPFTNYTFNGFAKGIQLGLDLKGGVMAVYDCEKSSESEGSLDDQIDATISRLTNLITEDYPEATIIKQGDSQIRIEVPDVDDPDKVLELIGEPAKLEFKKEKSDTAEAVLTGKDIKSAEYQYDSENNQHGVSITFTTAGATKFYNVTSELATSQGSLYIYLGGQLFSSPTVKEAISGGKTFISGGMSTQAEAEAYATKILSGTYSVDLTLSEKNIITATLGENALLLSIIAGLVGLTLIFVFMYIVYKNLGLIADLSLIFYTIILMFLLSVLPFIQLTLPGVAGIILGLGMAVDGNIVICERIKDECKSGKKIPASVKSGFKRASVAVLDSNITTIIAALVLAWLGTGSIRGFAYTLLISMLVSMFTTLVVTRGFINIALDINSTNYKRYGLTKGADLNKSTSKDTQDTTKEQKVEDTKEVQNV